MSCRCNTEKHDPNCHIDHTLSILEANIAFPQRGQESNPMKARCGLEDCDCEHTIEKLMASLEEIARREGAYNRDPRIHAENTIDNMERIARDAIDKAKKVL